MSEAKRQTSWTWEAYLDWEARQPSRYELVDGQIHAMGGATAEHDTIGNNLRAALHAQLRGKPSRPHGPDLKVRAGKDSRYPDALIDSGPRVPGALYAHKPVAVFEVLSKSTGWIDQSLKLRDYNATPTIRTRVTRTDGLASKAPFFLRAWTRRSRSPSSASRCHFSPSTRESSSLPIGCLPPDRRTVI